MKLIPDLKHRIEVILGTTLHESVITIEEWNRSALHSTDRGANPLVLHNSDTKEAVDLAIDDAKRNDIVKDANSWRTEDRIFFRVGLNEHEGTIVYWGCSADSVTLEVQRLIELLISSHKEPLDEEEPVIYENDREQLLAELGQWLRQQLKHPTEQKSVPEHFVLAGELNTEKIPFLLQCETPDAHRIRSKELNKLLESYFGEDIMLIPVGEQEWLFLGNEQIVTGEAEDDTTEARKDLLNAFCLGLYELVASEWAGVFHLSASLPCMPAEQLSTVTALLQESIHLGRSFHVVQHIHLPWDLHLERLVASIPEQQCLRFIQETGKGTTLFSDSETLATLETFFNLDCNVSETAKRLFIHRNTLVYRLDKIKQEIGYDVRNFESAVLVRLLLLMYKVTKKL